MKEADTILFGRRTYQLMESYWPSKDGLEDEPQVAQMMNETEKVVVSKSLQTATQTKIWKHVRLINDNVEDQIKSKKNEKGGDIILLGSSTLGVSLLEWGLLDE